MRRLREWSKKLEDSKLKQALDKLISKSKRFSVGYDYANSLRTSSMVDRLINRIDRRLFIANWWHGTVISAEKGLRTFCLIENFFLIVQQQEKNMKVKLVLLNKLVRSIH